MSTHAIRRKSFDSRDEWIHGSTMTVCLDGGHTPRRFSDLAATHAVRTIPDSKGEVDEFAEVLYSRHPSRHIDGILNRVFFQA